MLRNLYNDESPRRPLDFLPRKVAHAAAAISLGLSETVTLGDLGARRDWGYAPDYVRAMLAHASTGRPQRLRHRSGEGHSVQDLVAVAFGYVGLDWEQHVRTDPALGRGSAELHDLIGNASKASDVLGRAPTLTFNALVAALVDAELGRLSGATA